MKNLDLNRNRQDLDNIPTGVSIESASYIEKNNIGDDERNFAKMKIMKKSILQNYFLKNKVLNQKT